MRRGSEFEILVDVECDSNKMQQLTRMLSREVAAINLSQYEEVGSVSHAPMLSAAPSFGELPENKYKISSQIKSSKFVSK